MMLRAARPGVLTAFVSAAGETRPTSKERRAQVQPRSAGETRPTIWREPLHKHRDRRTCGGWNPPYDLARAVA